MLTQYSFGPLFSFLFSWTAIVAMKPSSGAIIATILGEYATRVFLHILNDGASDDYHKFSSSELPQIGVKGIASAAVLCVVLVQCISPRLGTHVQNTVTAIKLILLASIPVIAIVQVARGKIPAVSKEAFRSLSSLFRGSSIQPSSYALALYSGLWAYDGWDQVSFVAGEMKNPKRDVPRAIHSSTLIVSLAFVAVVISYFTVLPPPMVARTNSVALDFGSTAFGLVGGILFSAMVAFSCLGALNGHLFTYARLTMAAGQESFLPKVIGATNTRLRTPVNATLLSAVLVLFFVLFGSGFASLVNFCGVCAWFWYGTTVAGLLYLRIKEPNLNRPYQTWLITPIAFTAMALFLLVMPIFAAPMEALAALLFIVAGVPLYYASQHGAPGFLQRFLPGESHGFSAVPTDVEEVELEGSSRNAH